jgi:trimethylamine---corrinoid protein Co-methyltransferase
LQSILKNKIKTSFMKQHNQILSEEEKQNIHQQSLKVLANVGIRFMSKKALTILKQNGAQVDFDNQLAKIPEEMVVQALKSAPSSFTLGARNAEFDFALPSSFTGYTLDGAATYAIDFQSGERHPAKLEDLRMLPKTTWLNFCDWQMHWTVLVMFGHR